MKKILTFSLLLTSMMFLFSSCSKEVRLANDLEGDWKVVTYEIDGDNYISLLDIFTMEYNEYDSGESEGTFEWRLTDTDGDTEIIDGTYEINEEATEIELVVDGELITLDIDIDGSILKIDGTDDGTTYLIEANKQ